MLCRETAAIELRKAIMMRALLFSLPFVVACTNSSSPIAPIEAAETRRPIVLELFSSEGCSSCPPADIVLRDLARAGGHENAEIIALEEHVDYWNYLGWTDPYSSSEWTARQKAYSQAMGYRGVYTPQTVIDGRIERVGSDKEGILEAITEAAKQPKARVSLVLDGETVRVTVSELPRPRVDTEVLFALTEEGLSTSVPRGENAGVTVVHAPIARSMEKLGVLSANEKKFGAEKRLPLASGAKNKKRAIVIVQSIKKRTIVGAASLSLG